MHVNASYPKSWDSDPYVLAPSAAPSLKVDELVEGMKYPAIVKGEGVIVGNLFGPYDARLLRRSFVLNEEAVHLRVGATPALYARWLAFLASHPLSWPSLLSCPSPELLKKGYWRYRFRASASSRASLLQGAEHEVILSGSGDPGYTFTGAVLGEVALCLSGSTLSCTGSAAHSRAGGVLTPALAVNMSALRARLEQVGLLKTTTTVVHQEDGVDVLHSGDNMQDSSEVTTALLGEALGGGAAPPKSDEDGVSAAAVHEALLSTHTELLMGNEDHRTRKAAVVDALLQRFSSS
jgi:hypothetical protein